ncbi:MAG: c-type cytochrome [Longimicrobiales bacterium]
MSTTAKNQTWGAARWAVPLLIGLLVAGCAAGGTVERSAEDPVALSSYGAEVYGYSCARCHNARAAVERSDREWKAAALHMRARANLSGPQARAVIAFLSSVNVASTSAPVPAAAPDEEAGPPSAERGKELTTASGCAGCHVIDGVGGAVGPSLDDLFDRKDDDFVRRKIADPRFDNPNSVMPNFRYSSDKVESILAYLKSVGGE